MKKVLRAIDDNIDTLQKIRNLLGAGEMAAGLAEEAAELSAAASKYARIMRGVNPTPVPDIEADENLQEEFADAFLYAWLVGIDTQMVARIIDRKSKRWASRLGM
jgi:NTP pyrophosphatase (non-canonical NTP hydrolase)